MILPEWKSRFLCRKTAFFHILLLPNRCSFRRGFDKNDFDVGKEKCFADRKGHLTMTEKLNIAVLGGDGRQIAMARALREYGHSVFLWGFSDYREVPKNLFCTDTWEEAVSRAHAVILPLPVTADGVRLYCPLHNPDEMLRITSLMGKLSGRLLLGGRLREEVRSLAEQKKVAWIDYFESEVFQLKNALPTAEGAIALAMQELPVTLDGTQAAVVGYGRIGTLLGEKLSALGAHVSVYARRQEQLTLAALHRHVPKRLTTVNGRSTLCEMERDCRIIFNTVPQWLFTREVLQTLPPQCIFIDLASPPGGIDRTAAAEMGLKVIWGTALPGKYAPESAGRILAETVEGILEDFDFSAI